MGHGSKTCETPTVALTEALLSQGAIMSGSDITSMILTSCKTYSVRFKICEMGSGGIHTYNGGGVCSDQRFPGESRRNRNLHPPTVCLLLRNDAIRRGFRMAVISRSSFGGPTPGSQGQQVVPAALPLARQRRHGLCERQHDPCLVLPAPCPCVLWYPLPCATTGNVLPFDQGLVVGQGGRGGYSGGGGVPPQPPPPPR